MSDAEIAGLVGLMALPIAIYLAFVGLNRRLHARSAGLVVEHVRIHADVNAPGLRQPVVTVRNRGRAGVHETGLVIADAHGALLTHRIPGPDELEPGARANLVADLPVTDPGEFVDVRVVWQDARGDHVVSAARMEGNRG